VRKLAVPGSRRNGNLISILPSLIVALLPYRRAILVAVATLHILNSAVEVSAQGAPNDWESLSSLRQVTSQVLLANEPRILVYYFDRAAFKAVQFDPSSGEAKSVDADVRKKFICLTRDEGNDKLAASACSSATGRLDPATASVRWLKLFAEDFDASEVDRSKVLLSGSNDQLPHITPYKFRLDDFLDTQKIGDDDFAATCNSLHLTSRDGIGAVNLLRTKLRPHFLARFPPIGDSGIQTKVMSILHLSSGAGAFICDQAAAIGSHLALIVSRDQLVIIDVSSKTYSVANLPIPRRGFLIVRAVSR
jgi:hypothetical protein